MKPTFFAKQSDFRKWLQKNHKKEKELLVGFYKVNSGKPCMTWSQSVDEALCFGWIDAVRKSIDKDSYTIRFTHRNPGSVWSSINIKKIKDLVKKGLIQPAGLEAFKKRKAAKSRIYSYEKEASDLSPAYQEIFKANNKAWAFFQSMAPSYRKLGIHRVMDAKQEKTRLSRLATLIAECEAGRKP
ncbi:MAG: YdeI family protein [Chitinophagales bacterium]